MELSKAAVLKSVIAELEITRRLQEKALMDQYKLTYDRLRPLHMLRTTLEGLTTPGGIGSGVLNATLCTGGGWLARKLLLGRSPGLFKKMLGTLLEMGLTGLLGKLGGSFESRG